MAEHMATEHADLDAEDKTYHVAAPPTAKLEEKAAEKAAEPGLLDRMAMQARLIFGGGAGSAFSKAEDEHDDRTDGAQERDSPPPEPASAAPAPVVPVDPGPLAIDMPDLARSKSRRLSN